jgi:hypothetical protein
MRNLAMFGKDAGACPGALIYLFEARVDPFAYGTATTGRPKTALSRPSGYVSTAAPKKNPSSSNARLARRNNMQMRHVILLNAAQHQQRLTSRSDCSCAPVAETYLGGFLRHQLGLLYSC